MSERLRTGDLAFGKRLRRCREAAGLTQAQLGLAVGVEQNTISDYETGSAMPEAKDLSRLAKAVKSNVDFLLAGIPGMPDEVAKFLLALPKRSWRRISGLSRDEREQAVREIAALLDAKIAKTGKRPSKGRRTQPSL